MVLQCNSIIKKDINFIRHAKELTLKKIKGVTQGELSIWREIYRCWSSIYLTSLICMKSMRGLKSILDDPESE